MPIATTVAFPVTNILPGDLKQLSSNCFHRMGEASLWAVVWVLKGPGHFLTKLYAVWKGLDPLWLQHQNVLSAECAPVPGWERAHGRTAALAGQNQGSPWTVSVQSDKVAADAFVQLLKLPLLSPCRNAACLKCSRSLIGENSINFYVLTSLLLRNYLQVPPLFRAPQDEQRSYSLISLGCRQEITVCCGPVWAGILGIQSQAAVCVCWWDWGHGSVVLWRDVQVVVKSK